MKQTMAIFGGGGVWGVAWMTGVAMGLADRGIDLGQARGFIGTSAGSVVGSQIASGLSAEHLFARQTDPAKQPREYLPANDGMKKLMALVQRQWESPAARLRATAELALQAETVSAERRRADIVERLGLPSDEWPARPLSLTTVDSATCELCVFNAQSGVNLVDAVAASCAVPGVWPPTPIKGRIYLDGGIWRTAENAQLAQGAPSVLILAPFGRAAAATPAAGLEADIAELRQSGSRVALIAGDAESLATLSAAGPLDPSTRAATAAAGRAQGHREAEHIQKWLA